MKFNNFDLFNGKSVVTSTNGVIDAFDGSRLTGIKFTQLSDIGSPSPNKLLVTNSNGDGIGYLDVNFNASKVIDITINNSEEITWNNDICYVYHNMNGYVYTQVFDDEGYGIPLVPLYIDEDNIAFHFDSTVIPTSGKTYKLICSHCGVSLNEMSNLVRELFNKGLTKVDIVSTVISPVYNTIYNYSIVGNEVFTFETPTNTNDAVNFRLYLTMPSTSVSFTLPTNIIWESEPDFTTTNALYMLVFEWNPVLNKWLGNQMWEPVVLGE